MAHGLDYLVTDIFGSCSGMMNFVGYTLYCVLILSDIIWGVSALGKMQGIICFAAFPSIIALFGFIPKPLQNIESSTLGL